MTVRTTTDERNRHRYVEQQKWFETHGGSRMGYRAHYADAIQTGWYTVDEVDAIFEADRAARDAAFARCTEGRS